MANFKIKTKLQADAGIKLPQETVERVLTIDANGDAKASGVSTTTLAYLDATSSIQSQLNDADTAISDHITDSADAHDASAISVVPTGNLAADDAQEAFEELQGDVDSLNSSVIRKDGSVAFTADQSMGGFKLTSLAAPTASSDAATKGYVDNALEGLKPKAAVRAASDVAGTLATDFADAEVMDGVTLATGDRILLKDQVDAEDNGIYIVQAAGAPVRATDFDSISPIDEVNKAFVAVQEGTKNQGKLFVQYGVVVTIGVDPINFTFFNSVSGLSGDDGITVSGSSISVDHDGEGLAFVATQLSLELDGATLSKSASGLKLSDTAVTPASLGSTAAKTASFTVDQQGRLTAASEQNIDILSSQVSDFAEAAQDSVGAMVVSSDTVTLTYDDATPELSAEVITQMSLTSDASGVKLVGDNATPGNVKYYGTDGAGTKGFHSIPAAGSAGDLEEASFSAANDQSTFANVTGFAFANAVVRGFEALVSVEIDATAELYETFSLKGIQGGAGWSMSVSSVGDDSQISFDINASGQIQYTSADLAGWVSTVIKFRALTTTV